jgi:hypothetical protein
MPGAARRWTNRQPHPSISTVRRPNRVRNRWVLSDVAWFALPRESGGPKFTPSFPPGSCLPFAGCLTRLAPSHADRLSRPQYYEPVGLPLNLQLASLGGRRGLPVQFDLDSGLPLSAGFPSRGSLSVGLILPQELRGPLTFSTPLFLHARRSDPGRPSGVSPTRRLPCWLPSRSQPHHLLGCF